MVQYLAGIWLLTARVFAEVCPAVKAVAVFRQQHYITIAILHDVPSRSLGIGRSQGDTHAKQEVRNCRGGSPYCRHQVDTDLPSLRVLLSMIPSAVIRAMYNSPSNRGHWNCYYGQAATCYNKI
jgi:hypothetical protein